MPRQQPIRCTALLVVGLMLGVGAVSEASAASQGQIGATSVAATTLGVVIPPSLQVVRPADSSVEFSAGAARHALCVSGRGVSAYAIAAAGSGEGGQFALSDGPNPLLYNAVMFSNPSEAVPLQAGRKTPAMELRATNVCQQVSLALKLDEGKPATGGQSGILTVVISPE